MRRLCIIPILVLLLTACASEEDYALAQKYKLELNYYENSVKFLDLGMREEAIESCERTELLRNECFTSLIQRMMQGNVDPNEYCEEVDPGQGINMTMAAFRIVYGKIDKYLNRELKQKINPAEARVHTLKQIKYDCENFQR